MLNDEQKDKLIKEFVINASRSSGPGGQHVNKVSTKIELRLNIDNSSALTDEEKSLIKTRLKSKLTIDNVLIITVQSSRSQLKNKNEAIIKCILILDKALKPVKARKATKPTHASKLKRLNNKKLNAKKKDTRRNINY